MGLTSQIFEKGRHKEEKQNFVWNNLTFHHIYKFFITFHYRKATQIPMITVTKNKIKHDNAHFLHSQAAIRYMSLSRDKMRSLTNTAVCLRSGTNHRIQKKITSHIDSIWRRNILAGVTAAANFGTRHTVRRQKFRSQAVLSNQGCIQAQNSCKKVQYFLYHWKYRNAMKSSALMLSLHKNEFCGHVMGRLIDRNWSQTDNLTFILTN